MLWLYVVEGLLGLILLTITVTTVAGLLTAWLPREPPESKVARRADDRYDPLSTEDTGWVPIRPRPDTEP